MFQAFALGSDRALDIRDPNRVEGGILLSRGYLRQSTNCFFISSNILPRFGLCDSGLESIDGKDSRGVSDKVEAVKSSPTYPTALEMT